MRSPRDRSHGQFESLEPRRLFDADGLLPPTFTSLTASPTLIARGQSVMLTANDVTDPDGTVVRVDFFCDANRDAIVDDDELIASDADGSDGYHAVYESTLGLPLGYDRFIAAAVDDDGLSSEREFFVIVTTSAPTPGTLSPSVATFGQGDAFTLAAAGMTDLDGTIASVQFYVDLNADGIASSLELLGSDHDPAGGYTYTLARDQSETIPTGEITFLSVAIDNDDGRSMPASASVDVLFSLRSDEQRQVAGTADNAGASRVVTVTGDGDVIVFEEGWTAADATLLTGAPKAVGDATIWADRRDGLVYAAAPTIEGVVVFQRAEDGSWTFRNVTVAAYADDEQHDPPIQGLTTLIAVDGTVLIAGITRAGDIVAYKQSGASPAGPLFEFVDIAADLVAQGMATPRIGSLISYVPAWNAWHLAGIDIEGRIQSVWINPGVPGFTKWRVDDLTSITGAPRLWGQLAVTLTSWGGINLTGLDDDGELLTTWWVPQFGGDWAVSNLTEEFGGARFTGGHVSGYTTPWGGLNYAGIDDVGMVVAYWWTPSMTDWSVSPLLPESTPIENRPTGALTSSSSLAGTLNVYGASANGDVIRMSWTPAGSALWSLDNLTELAERV